MRIHFVLISEGPSDDGLIPHLESLCIECGADEVTGTAPDLRRLSHSVGHSVADKLRTMLILEPEANLIFIHRDADSRDAQARYIEISRAVETCKLLKQWVAVVPIQETEAWLLLDEVAIKQVAGKPNSRANLQLPSGATVESIGNPKEVLQQAIITSAEVTGRRLAHLRADFARHRRLLLLRLPLGGPLSQVPSWSRMYTDIQQALANLQTKPPSDAT